MDLSIETVRILIQFSVVNIVCFSIIEVLTSLTFRVVDKISKKFQNLLEAERNKSNEENP